MGIINKVMSRIHRVFILKMGLFDVKKYMSKYNQWLKERGMNIVKYDGVGYIHPSVYFDGSDFSRIIIGRNVTISKDVIILTHDYSIWNGMIAKDEKNEGKRFEFVKPVVIGNNCFIGARALLLPGTKIGDNVIIGAASVIKGEIPSNTVWAGNPARQIMTIEEFTDRHIKRADYIEV